MFRLGLRKVSKCSLTGQSNAWKPKQFGYSTNSKEQKILVDGVDINYLKVGSGPHHVLCFPGALGSIWTDFKPQVEKLNRSQFTVVAWDPPGYGKSRPPARKFPPDFYYQDADWAVKLMEALEIKKYSLLGWSDGGISSLILAAKYPQHVEKLVVWGSNAYIIEEDFKIYESVRDLNKWSDRMKAAMIAVYGEEYFTSTWEKWCDAVCGIYKEQQSGDICKWLLPFIQCPTLILHGKKDPLVAPQHHLYLHNNIKGARLHVFDEGKHNIHLRYADEFNKIVENFLNEKK
ncbi:valacyclovir hydrolase [Anabrus simplex]|uniref:valacyclovir hydrolase n=1 Tax=Anabrus simplex TaxID=316456 RepID=UPI0035A339B6